MAQQTDKNQSVLRSIDYWTILIYLALLVFGWVSVCGASYTYGETDIFSLDSRSGMQIVWIGTSIVLGLVILLLDDRFYDTFAFVIYGVLLILLFATIFNPHSIKGSRSWLVLGPLRIQPAEFAKFATALALAKVMSIYGYDIHKWKHFAGTIAIILLPMIFIVLQRETGSALVYVAFFMMFYREGMPGSILFTGVAMVIYFVVGIRYADVMLLYTPTSIGKFVVLLLIQIFSAGLVYVYTENKRDSIKILIFSVGFTLVSLMFSLFVIPFDIVFIQLIITALMIGYLLWQSLATRIRNYMWIALFSLGSVLFFNAADYVLNNVMEPHQRVRINVLLGLEEDLKGAGYNVHQSQIAIGSGGIKGKGFLNGTQTKLKYVPEQAGIIPSADTAPYPSGRAPAIPFWQGIRIFGTKHIPFPCVYQCGNGTWTYSCYRYPTTILQLWRFIVVGIHHSSVYLPAYRCWKKPRKILASTPHLYEILYLTRQASPHVSYYA